MRSSIAKKMRLACFGMHQQGESWSGVKARGSVPVQHADKTNTRRSYESDCALVKYRRMKKQWNTMPRPQRHAFGSQMGLKNSHDLRPEPKAVLTREALNETIAAVSAEYKGV